jgi:hypothetical protein
MGRKGRERRLCFSRKVKFAGAQEIDRKYKTLKKPDIIPDFNRYMWS